MTSTGCQQYARLQKEVLEKSQMGKTQNDDFNVVRE